MISLNSFAVSSGQRHLAYFGIFEINSYILCNQSVHNVSLRNQHADPKIFYVYKK